MEKTVSKSEARLRRAGLIIGLLGVLEIFIWGLFNGEGGLSVYTILPALAMTVIFSIPLAIGLFIGWKWSFGGGLTLIALALAWLAIFTVRYFVTPSVNPVSELVMYAASMFSVLGLPYLVSGVLFVLAARRPAH